MMESSKTNIVYPEKPNNNPNELFLEMLRNEKHQFEQKNDGFGSKF